jgi:TPP-dependent pyruvate/acetoin dehydrogenase alpha subunit
MKDKNIIEGFDKLFDPMAFQDPLDINDIDESTLCEFFKKMVLIRLVEQKLAIGRRDGYIGGPVHLGVGQEAVAVGVSSCLRKSDRIFGAHRSHSHLLAMGSTVQGLFAEVLGKESGVSRGMGGSMHLWDGSCGFYGSVPIVAGTVSLAVGAGLAAKLEQTSDLSVAYLGDGAVEEGVVQESLNLARMLNTPTLFVVENNLFASHMHISERQPCNLTARFAEANLIPYEVVDGNDVVAVAKAAGKLVASSRAGGGPVFLEAVTFRWYGHVDWREDSDVGVNRSSVDIENWKRRDPVGRLRNAIVKAGIWSDDKEVKMLESLQNNIEMSWEKAMTDPYPLAEALLNRVYAN